MARPKTFDGPAATPENTPLPGGGSFHWDDAIADWAENPPYGTEAASIPAIVPADPAPAPSSIQPTSE